MVSYIVLCPKTFAGTADMFSKEFLRFYLNYKSQRATVANEVWDTWRYRLVEKYDEPRAKKQIVHRRGYVRPENNRLEPPNYNEPEPQDYSAQMVEKTKDLVKRAWAEIEVFITDEPDTYTDLKDIVAVEILTPEEFYYKNMDDEKGREIVEAFNKDIIYNKQK